MKLGTKRLIIYAIFGVIAAVLLSVTLNSCAQKPQENESFAMNTVVRQTIYGDKKKAQELIALNNQTIVEIDNLMSKTNPTSDVSRINHAGDHETEVSNMTAAVLYAALEAAEKTDGAFNPAIGGLMYVWGFGTELEIPPGQATIDRVLNKCDYNRVAVNGNMVNAGMQEVDLGGIAKGYALDRVRANMDANGMDGAMITVGGGVYARGTKPDGEKWVVGVRDPHGSENDYVCTVTLQDEFVSTSGTYERGYTYNNVYYHHILDPHTGYPADNGLNSVSVISADGMETDIYSTALFVMGLEDGMEFAEENGLHAIFITATNRIYLSEGFGHDFTLTNTEYEVRE